MKRIVVVDYGMGNLRSVSKAVETVAPDDEVLVTSDAALIKEADRVICPGQGAALDCMQALQSHNLVEAITEVATTRPFFGICMGLQVLLTHSDENDGVDCLGIFDGRVQRFAAPLLDENGGRLKVPHMGWSEVSRAGTAQAAHPMWEGIDDGTRFYFAHSYYCLPDDKTQVAATTHYGQSIAVAMAKESVFACQFHPEKSANSGLQLLTNFVRWNGTV